MQLSSPYLVNSAIQKAWEIAESVGMGKGVWFDSKRSLILSHHRGQSGSFSSTTGGGPSVQGLNTYLLVS